MNTKKLSGIREMGSLVLATALYWIVSKNCSDLSRKKKLLCTGVWPSAQSFDPRGSRTACEACQNAKRMRHGVHFFLKKRHAFYYWVLISGTFSGYDFVCVRHGLAGLRQNCSGSLVSFFIRL